MSDLRKALLAEVEDISFDARNGMEDHDAAVDRILAIPGLAEDLARKCDLCDKTGKDTLRCNECALIMASDY